LKDVEEVFRGVRHFPGYRVTSYGRVLDPSGEMVMPFIRAETGEPCVSLEYYEYSFNGPIWFLMLNAFYGLVDVRTVSPLYRDDDPTNLDIYNLRWEDAEGIPILFRRDEHGDWKRYRKQGRKVRLVETGEVFDNARECSESYNLNLNALYMCLRGTQKSHLGYHFEYSD